MARSLIAAPRWWEAFPIVDPMKWNGFSLFVAFNDTFFMAAFFLLSGLFVWKSLRRKGAKRFLRERAMRLGLPFLFGAFAIAPLAYYATYRQINTLHASSGFWRQWLHLGVWSARPSWFLWVLFTFDLFVVGIAAVLSIPVEAIAVRLRADRPMRIFMGLTALSAACFAPMAGAPQEHAPLNSRMLIGAKSEGLFTWKLLGCQNLMAWLPGSGCF